MNSSTTPKSIISKVPLSTVKESSSLPTPNGAADFPSAGANASAVPDHPILGPLIRLSNPIGASVDFIIACFLSCEQTWTLFLILRVNT